MRTAKTLIRLGGCPGWSEFSLGAHSHCLFCHVAAQLYRIFQLYIQFVRTIWHHSLWSQRLKIQHQRINAFEPCHEIMVLFVLHKLILQTRMRSQPVGLDVGFLVGPFIYFHTSCVRTAKALVRLRGCAGSPEPSLVAYVISTIISWAGSFDVVHQRCTCTQRAHNLNMEEAIYSQLSIAKKR